jgi:hypothetical protein
LASSFCCDTLPAVPALLRTMNRVCLLLVTLAVVACGSVPQTGGQSVGRITYTVSGGIAGWQRVLTIESDGKARVQVVHGPSPGVTDRQVDGAVLKRLHDLVSDPDFAALQPQYLPTPGGADMQDYVVSVEIDGKTIQTMTRDGAAPPRILRDVLGILNEILKAT